MLKNRLHILHIKDALFNFGVLVGKKNPEYKVMKYLLEHFCQNEILETDAAKIAKELNLDSKMVDAFLARLVNANVLVHQANTYFLNTDYMLDK